MPASVVLMIEPAGFRANPMTADDNRFQRAVGDRHDPETADRALEEFRVYRDALLAHGVDVLTCAGPGGGSPDAVFPNNWFSTHRDGRLVLYPMRAVNRRAERRPEIVALLRERYPRVIDFTAWEANGRFLEGTGSLVIDETERIVYASVSARTAPELVDAWAERLDYRPIAFDARDSAGASVYHTNVVLSVGAGIAVVCTEAIADPDRPRVLEALSVPGRTLIEITALQMASFCGNVLELENERGERCLAMSSRARRAFSEQQIARIEGCTTIIDVELGTIETHGGGGARCMLAELN